MSEDTEIHQAGDLIDGVQKCLNCGARLSYDIQRFAPMSFVTSEYVKERENAKIVKSPAPEWVTETTCDSSRRVLPRTMSKIL